MGKVDPLFINGVLGWLEDLPYASPQLSLEQLDGVLEAQKEWGIRFGFYTEMKRVLTTLRRLIQERKGYKRAMRARTRRAASRAGLSEGVFTC